MKRNTILILLFSFVAFLPESVGANESLKDVLSPTLNVLIWNDGNNFHFNWPLVKRCAEDKKNKYCTYENQLMSKMAM